MNDHFFGPNDYSGTSATLLHTLKANPDDESAWVRFVDRYEPLILQWFSKRGLAQNDADDVAQDVMLRMAKVMQQFEYDPSKSFRGWLRTITHHAWHDRVRKEIRQGVAEDGQEALASAEARDDLIQRLQREYDAEIMEMAVLRVRMRVSDATWMAFEKTAIQGLASKEAADQLGIDVARLYVDKSRVTKMLSEEVRKLEPETVDNSVHS